eukprot:4804700-Pyramimonas_sp.AAC.1
MDGLVGIREASRIGWDEEYEKEEEWMKTANGAIAQREATASTARRTPRRTSTRPLTRTTRW